MVEIWFSILTKLQVRRGVYHDVPELIAAIERYHERAQRFIWTKTPAQVLAKATKRQELHYRRRRAGSHPVVVVAGGAGP
jgi:hypothetical protein